MPKASINYPSYIVDRKGNNGWHKNGKRAYRRAVETISRCLPLYREARLYHLCFEGIEDGTSNKTNIAMLHALVQMAEREGIKCEWFGAREKADTTKKDHLHVFMLIDAYGIKVAKLFNQFEDGRVQQFCKAHGVKFGIFNPKDMLGIHGNNTYMALPYQGPGNRETELGRQRLEDALVWLSYLGKARSKPADDDKDGQIFPASRPKREKKPSPLSALPAEREEVVEPIPTLRKEIQNAEQFETQPEASTEKRFLDPTEGKSSSTEAKAARIRHEDGSGASTHHREGQYEMMWTPAETYVATQYEAAVDQQLDVEALRLFLLEHGIKRTPAQVAWELEEKYGFYGYASRNPAPAKPDTKALDAVIDRTPLKSAKVRHPGIAHFGYKGGYLEANGKQC